MSFRLRLVLSVAFLAALCLACTSVVPAEYVPETEKMYDELVEDEGVVRASPKELKELLRVGGIVLGFAHFSGRDDRRRPLPESVARRAVIEGASHVVPIHTEADWVYFASRPQHDARQTTDERDDSTDYAVLRVEPHCWQALPGSLRPRPKYTPEVVQRRKFRPCYDE